MFDEAHRLTPTAVSYYQAGQMLALNTPRALLMTATPHRGKEWLFRALLHLVDPDVYPPVESRQGAVPQRQARARPLPAPHEGRPRRLRRRDQAVQGPHAENESVPLDADRGGLLRRSSRLGRPSTSRAIAVPLGAWSTVSAQRRACTHSPRRSNAAATGWAPRCPRRPRSRLTRTATTPPKATRPESSTRARRPRSRNGKRSTHCSARLQPLVEDTGLPGVQVGPARPHLPRARTGSAGQR